MINDTLNNIDGDFYSFIFIYYWILLFKLNLLLERETVTWILTELVEIKFSLYMRFKYVSHIQSCFDLHVRIQTQWIQLRMRIQWTQMKKMIEAIGYVVETQASRRCVWWDRNVWIEQRLSNKKQATISDLIKAMLRRILSVRVGLNKEKSIIFDSFNYLLVGIWLFNQALYRDKKKKTGNYLEMGIRS